MIGALVLGVWFFPLLGIGLALTLGSIIVLPFLLYHLIKGD